MFFHELRRFYLLVIGYGGEFAVSMFAKYDSERLQVRHSSYRKVKSEVEFFTYMKEWWPLYALGTTNGKERHSIPFFCARY